MSDCSKILENILSNPLATIGDESIVKLKHFFNGYCLGAGIDPHFDTVMSGFQTWVSDKFGTDASLHWTDVIYYVGGDFDYAGFQRLKELWSEYKTDH